MAVKSQPEIVELHVDQLETILNKVEHKLGAEDSEPLRKLLRAHQTLTQLIQEKNISIARLRKLLFGSRTERTRDAANSKSESASQPTDKGASPDERLTDGTDRRRRPNHGRIPAQAYTGCERVVVTHEALTPGAPCPHCCEGTLYRQKDWPQVVRLIGQPPVGGQRYELERLRCGLCGKTETAPLPEEAGPSKYDPTVAAMIAALRYGQGLPWNRIEQLQQAAGIPLPASIQWELVRDAIDRGVGAAYRQLLVDAAQGSLVHNDDTYMRILDLTAKLNQGEPLRDDQPGRRGVFTTNLLSTSADRPTISLFFTGPRHSGENLRELLAKRMADLPPPIQMCDALSRNMPGDLQTIVANCLSHARRNFHELADVFPAEVRHVLEIFKQVYAIDAKAKLQGLSPEDRLQLHQHESRPLMDALRRWLDEQLGERKVEPNSSLGKAIAYMLKHWEKLTLFLRVAGAPLDNNVCEQALKMAIRHRRNSLFYKSERGAKVGDTYMSLIHTCRHSHVDPFDYLTQLQRHHERVAVSPADWMPWNYQRQLASV